jgi:hypothetical protein
MPFAGRGAVKVRGKAAARWATRAAAGNSILDVDTLSRRKSPFPRKLACFAAMLESATAFNHAIQFVRFERHATPQACRELITL